ncbi:unnamed protein product [Durusdinium trenchii]|uniref:Uncharacterized protein n=1 Tax=Durusdinium trenchii TaxID=1381693 RepID=A0ABP0K8X3_9DINO
MGWFIGAEVRAQQAQQAQAQQAQQAQAAQAQQAQAAQQAAQQAAAQQAAQQAAAQQAAQQAAAQAAQALPPPSQAQQAVQQAAQQAAAQQAAQAAGVSLGNLGSLSLGGLPLAAFLQVCSPFVALNCFVPNSFGSLAVTASQAGLDQANAQAQTQAVQKLPRWQVVTRDVAAFGWHAALDAQAALDALGLGVVVEQAQAVAEAQQRAVVQAQAAAAAEQARLQQQQQQQQREQAIAQAKQRREEKLKEAQAEREAEEKLRCHLHKKPNSKCKFCKRHQEHVTERDEKKAALSKSTEKERRFDLIGAPRGALEIVNTKTYGFSPLLQTHVVESAHFKALLSLESFEQMIDEMNQLMDHPENAYIRCVGGWRGAEEESFLFVRFGLAPDSLWNWLGEYVLDDEELRPAKESPESLAGSFLAWCCHSVSHEMAVLGALEAHEMACSDMSEIPNLSVLDVWDSEWRTTIGEFVEGLLSQDKYYSTVLPRLPMSTKRQLEAKLAPIPQSRKRSKCNLAFLEVYREQGVKVEISHDGEWVTGTTLELIEDMPSRLKVLVKMDNDDSEKVIRAKIDRAAQAMKTDGSMRILHKLIGKAGFVPFFPPVFGRAHDFCVSLIDKRGRQRLLASKIQDGRNG